MRASHKTFLVAAAAALFALTTTPIQAQDALAPASAVARDALARHRDANGLLALSAEGQALYERDVIKLDGYGYCGRSIALAEQGEFRQSIRAASKALHIGNSTDNEDLRSLAQRDLAIAYSYAGLLDEAERFAQGALALTPKQPQQAHAPAHKVLGDVAVRRGRYGDAADAYKRSLGLASERFRPLVQVSLANAYTAAGRPREALEQLDQLPAREALALAAVYQRSRANALLAAGLPDQASVLFKQIAADTASGNALYNRLWANEGIGRVELQRGDKPAALKSYLETVRLADSLRGKFQSEEFKTGLFGDIQTVFDTALDLSISTRDFEAAWLLSEASRSRSMWRWNSQPEANANSSNTATTVR